jgi:hypothetical protein
MRRGAGALPFAGTQTSLREDARHVVGGVTFGVSHTSDVVRRRAIAGRDYDQLWEESGPILWRCRTASPPQTDRPSPSRAADNVPFSYTDQESRESVDVP